MGGVTTIFTLVNSVLLRPLPYPTPGRLVTILTPERMFDSEFRLASGADFRVWKQRSQTLEQMALYRRVGSTLNPDTDPERVMLFRVTSDLFPLLGIRPLIGRAILPEDEAPDSPMVVFIGYEFWQSHFGGSPNALGQTLTLVRDAATIIGVMPASFRMPEMAGFAPVDRPTLWQPLRLSDRELESRRPSYTALGRLAPGFGIEAASAEMEAIAGQLAEEYPETNSGRVIELTPLLDEVVGDTARVIWIFFGAVCCVVLIAMANLINLQISRNAVREREIYIRTALGAGRMRLVRQLLTESVLLGLTGGALGFALASGTIHLVLATIPARFPRAEEVSADLVVFLFSLGISIGVGVVFGLIPALRTSRSDLAFGMREGVRTTISGQRSRLQRTLIGVEAGLALLLLIGAGLLANSYWRLMTVDAGMDEENLMTVRATLPARYRESEQNRSFWYRVLESVQSLPDVERAAVVFNASPPLSGGDILLGGIYPEGQDGDPRDGLALSNRKVTADFFTTIGVPIVAGRPILDTDTDEFDPVVVLNESGARALWPDGDAVGKRIRTGRTTLMTVVGIAADFQHRRVDGDIGQQMYTSARQGGIVGTTVTVLSKTRPAASGTGAAIRTIVANAEREADIAVATMTRVRWESLAEERFRTAVLLIFATVATFLALVGIWGIVSYSVVQRNREIGLRLALGATEGSVTLLMLRQALVPLFAGVAVGLAASVGLERFLGSYLFEIKPTDLVTYTTAVGLLCGAALAASLVPARRAARVDPMVTLRYE